MDYISDPGIRTNSGAPLLTPWSARGMSDTALAAQQAKDAHAAAVQTAVGKAEQTPKLSAAAGSQDFIRSEIQGLQKRLQVLQKLYAGNPKEMARALAQIFKELRADLKAYKAATGQDFEGADAAATAATTPAPAASDTSSTAGSTDSVQASGTAQTDPAGASSDSTTDPAASASTTQDPTTQDPTTKAAVASYAEVDQALREAIGNDGLQFLDTLKGIISTIEQKMATPARIQYAAQKHDKDTDKIFKDMDDSEKALEQDMSDMRDDISHDAPTLGLKVSVAA